MAIVYSEYGPYDDGQPAASMPDSAYVVRGNYRMPKGFAGSGASGALEVRDASGNWVPVTAETAPAGYDYRQDSNTQASNERLRFDQAFGTAPADVPITNLQQWAMANGWQEPDRSNNEGTLGAMFSNIAPYAGLMLGGIGAMGGFAGGLGAAGGLDAASLAAGDAMAGAIPAGELGAWTGAGAAGTTAGSGAMDWSNLGDLWDYGSSAADSGSGLWENWQSNIPDFTNYSGQMTTIPGLEQSLPGVPWDLSLNGVQSAIAGASALPDWLKNAPDTIKSLFSSASGSGGATGFGGSGSTDLMRLLGGLGAAGLGAYASSKQTSALDDMAKRYEGYGAPYRQKLSDLYANPSSFLTSPEVKTSVDQGTNSLMRSLSMSGNPFGSGNALTQGQNYASDQLFGKLGQEKDRLANFGGLSTYNSAAPVVAKDAISSSMGGYRAAGDAMGNIFNPPQTQAQTMADFFRMMGK